MRCQSLWKKPFWLSNISLLMSCSSQNDSGLTRELVGIIFMALCRCTDYGPILRKIVFWLCRWIRQIAFGPILNASIGNLETEDRVREERGPFPVAVPQRQALSIIVHSFCCISEQQCSMKIDLSCLHGFKHCSSYGFLFVDFPQL